MARSTTPTVSDLERNRLKIEDGELDGWQKHGTRGARPRYDYHDSLADLFVKRGAFRDGEYVTVECAEVTGVADDGETFKGEAEIRRSPYHATETVTFEEIELPTTSALHQIGQHRYRPFAGQVPHYYEMEIERKEEIADACPIDVYCSSINPAWGWRWKLMSYYEARPQAAESCETLIIDSGFNRWGSPDDVLEAAAKTEADYVMATDVTGMESPYACPISYCSEKFTDEENLRTHICEEDGRHEGIDGFDLPDALERTLTQRGHNTSMPSTDDPGIETQTDAAIEGIRRFMAKAEELGIEDRVILPIQPDYMDFLDRLEKRGWLDMVDYISVGGMLGIDDVQDRIDALHAIRNRVGPDMKIHALAPGTQPEMLHELQQNPSLIDSLDVSTPEQAPGKDQIPDATGQQHKHIFPRGTHSSTIRAQFTGGLIVQLAQMLSPLVDVEDTYGEVLADDDAEDAQASITEWATAN